MSSNGAAVATGARVDDRGDDAIAACLNRHSERVWDSYYRYLSWVSPAGPTGHERNIYGVYTLYDTADCANAVAGLAGGARTAAAHWIAAVEQVAKLTAAADPYYSAEDWKDDGMAKGKAMHRPLMDAFQAFATADRTLRARFDADADARDHQILEKAGDSADTGTAFVHLRLAARTLVHVANVPWRKLASLDRGRFEEAADETTRSADAFATAARATGGAATDLASKADELVVTMRHLRRRLGPRPGWSTGDHLNLDNQLAQWMVTGSPAQLVRSYDAFVDAANRAKLAGGLDATVVHLELPAAD